MAVLGVHIEQFLREGCGCKIGLNQSPCINFFQKDQFTECRDHFLELSNDEKDLFLLSYFAMHRVPGKSTERTNMPGYKIYGHNVCKKAFLFILNISNHKYKNIAGHYNKHGLIPRVHGNKGRLPINTTPFEDTEFVVSYIKAYAEDNSLPLPGRVPGHREETHSVIPSSISKKDVWCLYSQASYDASRQPVKYSLFLDLWSTLVPWIVIAKPSSDLCWTCQKFTETLSASPNLHDSEKEAMVDKFKLHLQESKNNRKNYQNKCEAAKIAYETIKANYSPFVPSQLCSIDVVGHYSWDYAQQLHYPTNPQQPGPIYFKTARKCSIFGIVNEGSGTQFNYLIDESVAVGKSAISTISYVHHYFQRYGMEWEKGRPASMLAIAQVNLE